MRENNTAYEVQLDLPHFEYTIASEEASIIDWYQELCAGKLEEAIRVAKQERLTTARIELRSASQNYLDHRSVKNAFGLESPNYAVRAIDAAMADRFQDQGHLAVWRSSIWFGEGPHMPWDEPAYVNHIYTLDWTPWPRRVLNWLSDF